MRYYYNLFDDRSLLDDDGVELPDLDAARQVAAEFFGAAIKDAGASFFRHQNWRLNVTDERGLILFAVTAFAQHAASFGQSSEQRQA